MIKKDDILIYIPQAYHPRKPPALEFGSQCFTDRDQEGDAVYIITSGRGQGWCDASCLVHKECYEKIAAYFKGKRDS